MNRIYFLILICIFSLKSIGNSRDNSKKHVEWNSSLPKVSRFTQGTEISERVEFWKKIYSVYTTKQGVFHFAKDPHSILGEIDLSAIHDNSVLTENEKQKKIQSAIAKKREQIAKKWNIKEIKKIRLQMGLKDRTEKALYLSGRYLPMMEKIFKKHGLPIELARLVFVESSFNILAQSKVGASGLWQIMPSVAKPQGYMNSFFDKRNHPVYATELAARILKENYQKLGSWPLAITAYNHGLTGVKRMKTKARSSQIEDLIDSTEKTKTWGFASKNFYACFLAVLEIERRASVLFGDDLLQSAEMHFKEVRLKQTMQKTSVLKWYNGNLNHFKEMNPHLNWSQLLKIKKIPAGVPLVVPVEKYQLALNQAEY